METDRYLRPDARDTIDAPGAAHIHESPDGVVFDDREGALEFEPLEPDEARRISDLQERPRAATSELVHSRAKIRSKALKMNENLDRLAHGAALEEVFGDEWQDAFAATYAIVSGKIVLHCGCVDERVPDTEGGLKIGTAGAGILMTQFDHSRFRSDDPEEIYAFLADPESGNAVFRAFVQSLKEQQAQGAKIVVSDHGGCGAAGVFCVWFKRVKLDPARCAKAAALRLHRALGLPGEPLHGDYGEANIPMNGDEHIHDAHCAIIDMTGRFRADVLRNKLRGLKHSGAAFLKDSNDNGQNAYLREELSIGLQKIIGEDHGVGLLDAPILVITDPSDPSSREKAVERFALADEKQRKIYFAKAPDEKVRS